jgi:hypothetical protein
MKTSSGSPSSSGRCAGSENRTTWDRLNRLLLTDLLKCDSIMALVRLEVCDAQAQFRTAPIRSGCWRTIRTRYPGDGNSCLRTLVRGAFSQSLVVGREPVLRSCPIKPLRPSSQAAINGRNSRMAR